ncbi:MAG: transporter [Xanthomonadaceae bacterium]|nr:transporter [Xanthomonadaceae bacterium]
MTTVSPGPCDRGIAGAAKSVATSHPVATLAATMLGSSVAFIDGSVVNVALPTIQQGLDAPDRMLPWVINAYLLPLGALILLGGGSGDGFGRRRLFLVGLAIFTIATIGCAAAPGLAWLLAGRALQGIGAALLLPNSLALLGGAFEGEARGQAIGTWAAAGAMAGALGPLIGGWLTDAVGWRSIFLLNLPIAAGAGYLAYAYVQESEVSSRSSLDWIGASVATVGLFALTWALTMISAANSNAGVQWLVGIAGVALLAVFVVIEARRREHAIMPLTLFSNRSFSGLTLLTLFLYASFGGLTVLLPFFMIRIGGYSATAAGAAMLPLPIMIGLGSRVMGRLAGRHGGRWPLTIGALVVALGFLLYLRVGTTVDYWRDILPPTLVVALGMGMSVAPLTTSVMSSVDDVHVGTASGFNSAVARVAGLIAVAMLGYVFARQGLPQAFVAGFRSAVLVGAGLAIGAAASAFFLIRAPNTLPSAERSKVRES